MFNKKEFERVRKQFFHILFGGNGSGKTTLAIMIAIAYLESNPTKRVLFILTDDGEEKLKDIEEITLDELETFVGIKKIIIESAADFGFIADTYKSYRDPMTGERVQKEFNGLMIGDDLGEIFILLRRPLELISFFKKRRQPNIDFLLIFHGLKADCPPALFAYVNHLFLLQTADSHEWLLKQIRYDKRDEFEKAYFKLAQLNKTDPHACVEVVLNPLDI